MVETTGAVASFTRREREVLLRVALGDSNSEAAVALGIGTGTIGHHLYQIHKKTGIDGHRSRLAIWIMQHPEAVYLGTAAVEEHPAECQCPGYCATIRAMEAAVAA